MFPMIEGGSEAPDVDTSFDAAGTSARATGLPALPADQADAAGLGDGAGG
jgi:hypothetical protein